MALIVLDANILLYAYDSASLRHGVAAAWLRDAFGSGAVVGLPWQSIAAFIRIATAGRFPGERFSVDEASAIVTDWLRRPNVRALAPGEHHWDVFARLLGTGRASGALVMDAHLAAVTVEHGGTLYSCDRDFARFAGLQWVDPLEK